MSFRQTDTSSRRVLKRKNSSFEKRFSLLAIVAFIAQASSGVVIVRMVPKDQIRRTSFFGKWKWLAIRILLTCQFWCTWKLGDAFFGCRWRWFWGGRNLHQICPQEWQPHTRLHKTYWYLYQRLFQGKSLPLARTNHPVTQIVDKSSCLRFCLP